jgi:hypothetical protein
LLHQYIKLSWNAIACNSNPNQHRHGVPHRGTVGGITCPLEEASIHHQKGSLQESLREKHKDSLEQSLSAPPSRRPCCVPRRCLPFVPVHPARFFVTTGKQPSRRGNGQKHFNFPGRLIRPKRARYGFTPPRSPAVTRRCKSDGIGHERLQRTDDGGYSLISGQVVLGLVFFRE